MELGAALARAGRTTLRLLRDGERFVLTLGRDWDPDADFSRYGRAFGPDQLPCTAPRVLGDEAARAELRSAGAEPALVQLEAWMRQGRHEMVLAYLHPGLRIFFCHFIHSSVLGLGNGMHALRAGGIRRHAPGTPEAEVLYDGLNLARAMSFKCSAAEMPFGGSKSTLVADAVDPNDAARRGFIGWCIDQGHLMTGPDVGLSPELVDALASHVTPHILCGPSGPLGHTAEPTALGVLSALFAALRFRFGSESVRDKRFAIQGLGAVGLSMAHQLAMEGARLVVADPDASRVELLKAKHPDVEVADPEAILETEADVLCPCALGGVLTEDSIARLRVTMVYGAANNQLAAFDSEQEIALAELLATRGVLFQPDWTYTMGGILTGFEEYRRREAASLSKVHADIRRLAGDGTRDLLETAQTTGRTPTAVAVERHFPKLHPG
jgi:leucine dehydrogenase